MYHYHMMNLKEFPDRVGIKPNDAANNLKKNYPDGSIEPVWEKSPNQASGSPRQNRPPGIKSRASCELISDHNTGFTAGAKGIKKDPDHRVFLVARVGVEPTRCHHRRILSLPQS